MRLVALAAIAMTAMTTAASAQPTPCTFIEITATNAKEPAVDPDLKPLEKKLKKPPFSSYNVFRKLGGGGFDLDKNKAESLPFKQGAASVLLREKTEKRMELTITMDGADKKRVLDVKQGLNVGDWGMFVATSKDEGHILALTCK